MANERTTCPEWALRAYDGFALVTLVAGFVLLADGAGEPEPQALARDWADLAMAAFLPAILAFSIWLGRRRGVRDGDEFLWRLIAKAAVLGFAATIIAWSSWTMLAQSWVRPPGADQLMGVLLGSSALAYGWARLRAAA